LSGRGLCDELITRPEESYRLWCVVMCDLETSRIGAPYIYIYNISRLRVNINDNKQREDKHSSVSHARTLYSSLQDQYKRLQSSSGSMKNRKVLIT